MAAKSTSFRLQDTLLARMAALRYSGESMTNLIERAVSALETVSKQHEITPTVVSTKSSALDALEARVAALEARGSIAPTPDAAPPMAPPRRELDPNTILDALRSATGVRPRRKKAKKLKRLILKTYQ